MFLYFSILCYYGKYKLFDRILARMLLLLAQGLPTPKLDRPASLRVWSLILISNLRFAWRSLQQDTIHSIWRKSVQKSVRSLANLNFEFHDKTFIYLISVKTLNAQTLGGVQTVLCGDGARAAILSWPLQQHRRPIKCREHNRTTHIHKMTGRDIYFVVVLLLPNIHVHTNPLFSSICINFIKYG